MSKSQDSPQGLNVEQVLRLHNLTKDVSKFCERQLRTYLDAVAPLFRPRRILGDFVEGSGREGAVGAAQNLTELRETFQRACGRPIDLHRELTTPVESISTQLQIYPWEYLHEIPTNNSRKKVKVSSRWSGPCVIPLLIPYRCSGKSLPVDMSAIKLTLANLCCGHV